MRAVQRMVIVAVIAGLMGGCGDETPSASAGGSTAEAATAGPTQAQADIIAGKVTMPDGKTPLTGDIKDISISISGVSEAAERVSYSPVVKPDGTYRQKVSGGQYGFSRSTVTVNYNNTEFNLPLEPVGNLWNKNQDAADGIVQDFIWFPTGPTPYGKGNGLDISNATHWYGLSIGLRADGYRNDIGKVPTAIPDNSKLTLTLKPQGKAIDGSTPTEPIVLERVHNVASYAPIDLNDLLPAPYEMTGTVTFPDGTTKPLLLQGKGDYPGYKPSVQITVEKDGIIGGMWKPPVTYVID